VCTRRCVGRDEKELAGAWSKEEFGMLEGGSRSRERDELGGDV